LPEGVQGPGGINIEKLITKAGLADSGSDASRKRKAGAIQINGEKVLELVIVPQAKELVLQVGKQWCKVLL